MTTNGAGYRVADLADECAMDRSAMLKFLKRHGMTPWRAYTMDAAGHYQCMSFVSDAHAARVRSMRGMTGPGDRPT